MIIDAVNAKKWRVSEGYSQQDVANRIGATKNAYSQWEQGRSKSMSRDKMERLRALMEGRNPAELTHRREDDVWNVVVNRIDGLSSTLKSERLSDTSKGSAFCFELGFLTAIAEISGISSPMLPEKNNDPQ